jgi:hypothetical protein
MINCTHIAVYVGCIIVLYYYGGVASLFIFFIYEIYNAWGHNERKIYY